MIIFKIIIRIILERFSTLLIPFLTKGAINRAAVIPDSDFTIKRLDFQNGIILVDIHPDREGSLILINRNKKLIFHKCASFINVYAKNKKFCKHLAKLFLILNDKNNEKTILLLKDILENINEWEFRVV